jgi:hypothetical protein
MTDEIISGQTEQNVRKAVLATLILLGIYFIIRFYWNVLGFIELWASEEFVDLFKALFNLAILLLVGSVFVRQLRELRERREEWRDDTGDKSDTGESGEKEDELGEGGVEYGENEPAEGGGNEGEDESAETSGEDGKDDDVPWKQYGDVGPDDPD